MISIPSKNLYSSFHYFSNLVSHAHYCWPNSPKSQLLVATAPASASSPWPPFPAIKRITDPTYINHYDIASRSIIVTSQLPSFLIHMWPCSYRYPGRRPPVHLLDYRCARSALVLQPQEGQNTLVYVSFLRFPLLHNA